MIPFSRGLKLFFGKKNLIENLDHSQIIYQVEEKNFCFQNIYLIVHKQHDLSNLMNNKLNWMKKEQIQLVATGGKQDLLKYKFSTLLCLLTGIQYHAGFKVLSCEYKLMGLALWYSKICRLN